MDNTKQTKQAARADKAEQQATAPPAATHATTVRVCVKAGAKILTGRDKTTRAMKYAMGGEWVDLPAADLKIPSVRQAVETQAEIDARKKASPSPDVAGEDGRNLFKHFRSMSKESGAREKEVHAQAIESLNQGTVSPAPEPARIG